MCTRTCMVTKTITVMEDAYNLLLSRKNNNESFSEVIRKMVGKKGDIMRLAGAWKHLTNEEVEKRKSDIRKFFFVERLAKSSDIILTLLLFVFQVFLSYQLNPYV